MIWCFLGGLIVGVAIIQGYSYWRRYNSNSEVKNKISQYELELRANAEKRTVEYEIKEREYVKIRIALLEARLQAEAQEKIRLTEESSKEREKEAIEQIADLSNQAVSIKLELTANAEKLTAKKDELEQVTARIMSARRQYDQDVEEYEKKLITTKIRMIKRYREEREVELQALMRTYDDLKVETDDAICLINQRLKEWSDIERSAYEERENREQAQQQNRLWLSERSIEELRELYEACGKLKLANPQPLYKAIYELYLRGPVKDLGVRVAPESLCGIYKITNVKNGKVYVGQSVDIAERWKQHVKRGCRCDSGTLSGAGLYEAMWEDGVWNFSFQVLEECGKEQLNTHEKLWIAHFQSNEIGYNKKV